MPRVQDEPAMLQLWFEHDDNAVEDDNSRVALTKTSFECTYEGKKIVADTNRYEDEIAVPWTAGVMAHMWYLVKCAIAACRFEQNGAERIQWEPAPKGSMMRSIHELARSHSGVAERRAHAKPVCSSRVKN